MSVVTFETLLRVAFGERYDEFFSAAETTAYSRLDRALQQADAGVAVSFAFERVRLGVALALLQLLIDLRDEGETVVSIPAPDGPDDEARAVQRILHRALREAQSVEEIDGLVQAEASAFERLYTDLFVDDDGELVLLLFERTLAADTRRELDRCLTEAARLAEYLHTEPEA